VQNIANPEQFETWVATEYAGSVPKIEAELRAGEIFKEGVGHAEETIVNALGEEWRIVSGGTSRNVCKSTCSPLLVDEKRQLVLGGPTFRGMPDKTPYRMFWRSQ
jgi:hypothetical protein